MARRDNQGIQIAMIVFILTTLVFMVTTYFGWSSSKKLQGELSDLQSRFDAADGGLRSSEQLVSELKALIGLPSEVEDDEEIQSTVNKTVETYGQGLPSENQNFQDILEKMSRDSLKIRGELAVLRDENKGLHSEVEQIRKTEVALVAKARAGETQAVADLNRMQQQAQAYQTKQDGVRNKLAQDLDASKRAMNDLQAKTDATVAQAQGDLRQTKLILELKTKQITEMTVDRPDQFDGNVVGVVAATGTVWLNVGRAEGLRRKTTFSVWDAGDSNVRTAKRKASIEVTRILGDHRSEARITDPDYLNPIVRGDHIFSPIWSPGQKLGIALVGSMDIDGDGTDDRHYIRNLIEINGARIDAEDVDGKVQGEMTVNTRYLVVADIDDGEDQNPALTPMLNDAVKLGIEQTSLDELLDLMGYAGRARSVSFTGVVRPGDFAPKPRDGVTAISTGSTSYSKRTPLPRRDQANPPR